MQAVATHGPFKGGWLTLRRVLRCNPWGGWGFDPVPPATVNHDCAQCAAPVGEGSKKA